jgi:undecaprenyl-diphosphatase
MMSQILQYVFIGFIQGVVEWLPISSQGNLVIILTTLFNIPVSLALDYSVYLHIGTVFSALVYFRKQVFSLFSYNNFKKIITKTKTKTNQTKELWFIIFSVFVTTVMFCLLYFVYKHMSLLSIKAITLLVALLLIVTGLIQQYSKRNKLVKKRLTTKNALIVGFFQSLAIFPGISRSGITTSALVFRKFSPEDALKYSFLLSIPTIIIAEVAYVILNGISAFNIYLIISIIVAFIVGYITIDILLKIVNKINFALFCYILAGIYLILFFV